MEQVASGRSAHSKSHILLIYHTFPSMSCTCGALVGLLTSLLPSPSCALAVLTAPRPYAGASPARTGKSFLRLWSASPIRASKEPSFGFRQDIHVVKCQETSPLTPMNRQHVDNRNAVRALKMPTYLIKSSLNFSQTLKRIVHFNPPNYTRLSKQVFEGYTH